MSSEKKYDLGSNNGNSMEFSDVIQTKDGLPPPAPRPPFSEMVIIKNVLVVSFGFLFVFTAFQAMANFQTSLHMSQSVGSGNLAVLYGALVLSCMFLPAFLIAHLGCKFTIPIAMIGYMLYMGANFYPVWGLMGPAAALVGICAAPLWSAKCAYLTQVAVWYAKLTNRTGDAVINAFFGIFFMIFQTSQIWGNLISSKILSDRGLNETIDQSEAALNKCGANFIKPKDTSNGTSQYESTPTNVYILCGVFAGCALIGAVIVLFLLDRIKLDNDDESEDKKPSPKLLVASLKHVWKSPFQKLLIPLTIYSGVEQAFIGGDFTRSYISCSLGIWNVGYIMIVYGVVDAACSFLFGRLVQYVGHIPFFILAFLLHTSCQITLLFWTPDPDRVYIYYIIAALWGMGDAVIQTQINAYYGYLFTDNSKAAFSNYRLWESVGFIMTYAYNDYLYTSVKLYVCIGILCLGILGYGTCEIMERNSKKTKD